MKKKIYVAGRITDYLEFQEHFKQAEEKLASVGYVVLNPAILPSGLTQEEYMRICIPMLNIADEVFMLKGWEKSVGAKIEHSIAIQAGKEIHYE